VKEGLWYKIILATGNERVRIYNYNCINIASIVIAKRQNISMDTSMNHLRLILIVKKRNFKKVHF